MTRAEPQWQAAADAVFAADSLLIAAHIAPDGDAVGSLLGLASSLRLMGKKVTAAVDGGVPARLAFIAGSPTVLAELSSGEFDLMIAVDSSDIERIGKCGAYGLAHSKTVINLDHHPTNTRFGDIHLIAPQAAAAAEVVFDFLSYLNCGLSTEAAQALLTGLITDTRGFRISATNSRTLEIAQALMQKGASLPRIMARTLNSRGYEEVELWKRALPSVRLADGLIYATIAQSDMRQAGLDKIYDGGLVNHLVDVDEAKVSVVFHELPGHQVQIGFRSKLGYDVAALALKLGGGGHRQASGCTLAGSLEEVRQRVLPLAHQVIAKGRPGLG